MSVRRQMGLASRKALLARVVSYEVRDQHARTAPQASPPGRIVAAMERLADEAIAEPNGAALDEWLRASVAHVVRISAATDGEQKENPAGNMLAELAAFADGVSCISCSSGRICTGSARDDQLVEARGHCFRHIREVFGHATAITEAYYKHYVKDFKGPPRTTLYTSDFPGKPHDIPVELFVGGSTRYVDDSDGALAEVTLRIFVRRLDWKSWMAVLYVLLHELACHAYAGSAGTTDRNESLGAVDPFAEGWMDYVCSMMLHDLHVPIPPVYTIARGLVHLEDQLKYGGLLLSKRHEPERENDGKAFIVISGAQSARLVKSTLDKLSDPGPARKAMYRVSLGFNLLDRTAAERAKIVTTVEEALKRQDSVGYGVVARYLKSFLRHQDPERLFDQLVAL